MQSLGREREGRKGGGTSLSEGVDYERVLVKEDGRNLCRVQGEREGREGTGKALIDIERRGMICSERREGQD